MNNKPIVLYMNMPTVETICVYSISNGVAVYLLHQFHREINLTCEYSYRCNYLHTDIQIYKIQLTTSAMLLILLFRLIYLVDCQAYNVNEDHILVTSTCKLLYDVVRAKLGPVYVCSTVRNCTRIY